MSDPSAIMVTRAKAIAAVTTLIGTGNDARIEPMRSKQSVAKPRITYQRIGGEGPVNAAGGTTPTAEARLVINCDASTYDGAWALARALQGDSAASSPTGLSGFQDANGDTWHLVLGPRDGPIPVDTDQDTGTFQVIQDYIVWYSEAD